MKSKTPVNFKKLVAKLNKRIAARKPEFVYEEWWPTLTYDEVAGHMPAIFLNHKRLLAGSNGKSWTEEQCIKCIIEEIDKVINLLQRFRWSMEFE